MGIERQGVPPRNQKHFKAFFSKLPCIKTCLTKFEVSSSPKFGGDKESCGGGRKVPTKLDFEKVEDDFAT